MKKHVHPLPVPLARFDISGRNAVIVGASKGIGKAIAAAFGQMGARVTLVARNPDELEEAAALAGPDSAAVALDATDREAVARFFADRDPFPIVVYCAGTNRPKPFLDVLAKDYSAVMALNVEAAFFTVQAAAARLRAGRSTGSIILMSSQMGHVGAANRVLYCASKWALEGLSKAAAVELAPFGIRCNTIAPTFIETPLTEPFLRDDTFRQDVLAKIKLGRIGTVDDITGAALYLASDASSLVTGTSLVIDGGWTAD